MECSPAGSAPAAESAESKALEGLSSKAASSTAIVPLLAHVFRREFCVIGTSSLYRSHGFTLLGPFVARTRASSLGSSMSLTTLPRWLL